METEVERAVERIFRNSLEFVAVVARKAEIPQTMILGGIRADGVLWGEIGGDGRRRLVRTVVERVTVRQNSLLRTLARGYAWLQMIDRGEVKTVSELATKTGVDPHFVRHTLRLPLLSPKIQRAIINGTESEKLTLTALRTLETDVWEEQERIFGFADAQ